MKGVMLIGRNFHYYVREGELSADFERAFERALDKAVETIAKTMGIENQDLDLNPYTVLEDQKKKNPLVESLFFNGWSPMTSLDWQEVSLSKLLEKLTRFFRS